ncbi:MAG: tyrosine-type recombinase/integrase [Verrucomicrobiota bacterium]
MKNRYILFQRSGVFYTEDTTTGKQASLRTKDKADALRLLNAKNEAGHQSAMNLQIAQVYLQHGDPTLAARTWQHVLDVMISTKTGSNLLRWRGAVKDKALDSLRSRKLIETTAEHFLAVLKIGTVSTNVYLRRIHNYAVSMHWLPWPVLPKPNWPAVEHGEKRAITLEEHQKIIARELNLVTRAYYELLWHLGGAQTDVATLTAEDINWKDQTIAYRRHKTGTTSLISFGDEVAAILKMLPSAGQLFPALARINEGHRAKMFIKRLLTVGISGVSLHSYRYAWAERAMAAGYPERFAMQALGHTSKAVHRAYAKKAQVTIPPLENYEKRANKSAPLIPALVTDVSRN